MITKLKLLTTLHWTIVCFLSFMSTDAQQGVSICLLCYVCLSIPWSFYMRVLHFVNKKRKRAQRPDSFFFNDSDILKVIPIISCQAIHYSKNVFGGFSILVCIGVQVRFRSCIFHSSSRTWLALALASRLPPFDRKTLKNYACSADPGLLNETKDSWFPHLLSFFI